MDRASYFVVSVSCIGVVVSLFISASFYFDHALAFQGKFFVPGLNFIRIVTQSKQQQIITE